VTTNIALIDNTTNTGSFSVTFSRPFLASEDGTLDSALTNGTMPFTWAIGAVVGGVP
jgi:hypothetical protein